MINTGIENMFDDRRSKKIILIAHCLLNQNSISDGTADLPSQFDKVINLVMKNKIGIIQLPCPELICLGLDRSDKNGSKRELLIENTRIRKMMEKDTNKKILRNRAKKLAWQIGEYKKFGFDIIGLIGVNRSPSCGVETTTQQNKETEGRGAFIQTIEEEFKKRKLSIRMIGSSTSKEKESLILIKKFLTK